VARNDVPALQIQELMLAASCKQQVSCPMNQTCEDEGTGQLIFDCIEQAIKMDHVFA